MDPEERIGENGNGRPDVSEEPGAVSAAQQSDVGFPCLPESDAAAGEDSGAANAESEQTDAAGPGQAKPGRGARVKKHLKRAAVIAAGTVVASAVATELMFLIMFGRMKPAKTEEFPIAAYTGDNGLYCFPVEFPSGENMLRGYIVTCPTPSALVLIAHGMNADSDGFAPVVRYFADRGYAVLTYDGTASGRSGGKSVVGLQQARYDIRAAVAFIRSDSALARLPLVLLGHSAGAYGAAVEARSSGASAVVCVSAFETPLATMRSWATTYASVLGNVEYPFLAAHEFAVLGREANTSAAGALVDYGGPAMIVHGANDDAIPMEISLFYKLMRTHPNEYSFYLEEDDAHSSHKDILFTEEGEVNLALLDRIDAFIGNAIAGSGGN